MSSNRDNGFIPLTTGSLSAKKNVDLNLTVLAQADQARHFRPFGEAPAIAANSVQTGGCEPRVTVQRDGTHVSAIQVHCSCGQIIELACFYGPAGEIANSQ